MLVEHIKDYIEGEQIFDKDILAEVLRHTGSSFTRNFMGQDDFEPKLRMSNIGSCPRQTWLKISGADQEPFTARTRSTFCFGDLTEAIFMGIIRLMVKTERYPIKIYEDLVQAEVEDRGVPGHGDLPMCIEGQDVWWDIKSMSSYSYREFCKSGPDEQGGYPHSMQAYLRGAENKTGKLWSVGGWLAVKKETGHFAEHICTRDDRTFVPLAEDTIALVNGEEKPARPDWTKLSPVKEVEGWRCGYCAVKEACWGKLRVEVDNRGKPHYFLREK